MTRNIVGSLIGILIVDAIVAIMLPMAAQNMYGDPTLGILLAIIVVVASLVGWVKLAFGK